MGDVHPPIMAPDRPAESKECLTSRCRWSGQSAWIRVCIQARIRAHISRESCPRSGPRWWSRAGSFVCKNARERVAPEAAGICPLERGRQSVDFDNRLTYRYQSGTRAGASARCGWGRGYGLIGQASRLKRFATLAVQAKNTEERARIGTRGAMSAGGVGRPRLGERGRPGHCQ